MAVGKAASEAKDPKLAQGLNKLTEHENVPRKQKKFENFAKNALRWHDGAYVAKLYAAVQAMAVTLAPAPVVSKPAGAVEAAVEGGSKTATAAPEEKAKKKEKKEKKRKGEKDTVEAESLTPSKRKRVDKPAAGTSAEVDAFKWSKAIRGVFKAEAATDLPIKAARKRVYADWSKHLQDAGQDEANFPGKDAFKKIFLKKVATTKRVTVEGKRIRLAE